MSFKSRSIGLFAAAALSLTIIHGAVAQPVEQTAKVVLQDDATNGECAAAYTSGSLDLGKWTWNAGQGKYVYSTGGSGANGNLQIGVSQTISSQSRPCYISASTEGLTQLDTGGGVLQDGAVIPMTLDVDSTSAGKATVTTPLTGANVPVLVTIDPGASYEPATYQGTVTVSASKSSN